MTAPTTLSVIRRLFRLIDDEDVRRSLRRFQFQAQLILNCLEDIRLAGIRRALRLRADAGELKLVGSPVERKVVASLNGRLVDHRTIHHGALKNLAEVG